MINPYYRLKRKIVLAAVFATLAACQLSLTDSRAESGVTSAEKLFLEGRYDKAAQEAGRLIDARYRHRDELYYIKGLSELKTDKFEEARSSFEELIRKYPRSKRAFDAGAGIGDAYFAEGCYEKALKSYEDALASSPGNKKAALFDWKISTCREKTKPGRQQSVLKEDPFVSVQVGSFKSRRNADKLSYKLRKRGYDSFVDMAASGDGFYRVKIGRFASEAEAASTARRLKRAGYSVKICPK